MVSATIERTFVPVLGVKGDASEGTSFSCNMLVLSVGWEALLERVCIALQEARDGCKLTLGIWNLAEDTITALDFRGD